MFGYFDNNKYEKFSTVNDDSRIQRIFDAESKALTQINSTSESASAEIKKKSDDAVSQVNKSTNDATQQIIGKLNEKYNEIEQRIPLIAKETVDKTVQVAVDNAIKNAEPAAKKMVYDVTGAYNYGKTNYKSTEEAYQNISTNMLTNYKIEKTSSWFFLFFVVFVVGSVYGIYKFKYDNIHINELIDGFTTGKPKSSQLANIGKGLIRIAVICGVIMLCIIVFKTSSFKTNMSSKEALSILTTVAIIGVPIIGITMLTVENVDLMMRSFDNTIGYLLTKGDKMKECAGKVFGDNNYNDYSVIITQLFEENFPYYLSCMKKDYVPTEKDKNLNRFKNVFLNEKYKNDILNPEELKKSDNELHKLLEFVVKKRFISNMSWIAFSAIYVLYVCNLELLQ